MIYLIALMLLLAACGDDGFDCWPTSEPGYHECRDGSTIICVDEDDNFADYRSCHSSGNTTPTPHHGY